jgi:hypothetical protein
VSEEDAPAPPEMTLTVRAAAPVTVAVAGRERHEIEAELVTADDWPTATRDVIAMSEACGQARGELPLHATVAIAGAVAWAGLLAAADDLAALPAEPPGTPPPAEPQPEARIGPCPLHAGAGEDHVQVRTHGHWVCVQLLRGMDDGYTELAGLAADVRHVITRHGDGQLDAAAAFGEIGKLFTPEGGYRESIQRQVSGDIVRAVLEAVCTRDGISLECSVAPGEPARNFELALRLGIGHVFGMPRAS